MFLVFRIYWYAIVNNSLRDFGDSKERIEDDIPSSSVPKTIEVDIEFKPGRLVHRIAARALIHTLEDKVASITDLTDRYWNAI